MNSLIYNDGILIVSNGKDCMNFPCNEEFAGKILSSLLDAKLSPLKPDETDYVGRMVDRIHGAADPEEKANQLLDRGYKCVGDFGSGVLYVGVTGITMSGKDLCSFEYIPKRLPPENGSRCVNVYLYL